MLGVMPRAVGRPDVATLVRAYVDDHQSIPALAVQFGVAPQTVHNWLVAAGVPRRHSAVAPRGDVVDDEIRRLYCDEHRSGAEISNLLGCSASLVYFRLARLGIERRSPVGERRGPSDDELAHLYTECGLSLRDIGEQRGISTQTVRRWLIHAGIDRRRSAPGPAQGAPDECVELYQAGWSASDIAYHLGCSSATVYRRLEVAGTARRQPTSRVSRVALVSGLERGLSAPALAASLDVSTSCVCRALAREGLMTASQTSKHRRALRRAAGQHRDPLMTAVPDSKDRSENTEDRSAVRLEDPANPPLVRRLAQRDPTGNAAGAH
jgi:transposase-like protein